MSGFEGRWVNQYGSVMTLWADPDGRLVGVYSSSTGSTGTYWVLGNGSTAPPGVAAGVGGTFAIFWRSTSGGSPDPSWHWVSGLGGQCILAKGGSPLLSLDHALVATTPFPGLAGDGTYLDKLQYTPYTGQDTPPPRPGLGPRARTGAADPIERAWICEQADIQLVIAVQDPDIGFVEGTLTVDGVACPTWGFADTYAAQDGIGLEGLTLTAAAANGAYLCLCGSLDLGTGVLALLLLTSAGTPAGSMYVQTSATGLYFRARSL